VVYCLVLEVRQALVTNKTRSGSFTAISTVHYYTGDRGVTALGNPFFVVYLAWRRTLQVNALKELNQGSRVSHLLVLKPRVATAPDTGEHARRYLVARKAVQLKVLVDELAIMKDRVRL
jgi:hypothetical protein